MKIASLDVGTFHMYITSWGVDYEDWPEQWITDHSEACEAAGKSCILEEYGVDQDADFRTTHMTTWHDALSNSSGVPADLFWQYGLELSDGPTHDDGVSVHYIRQIFQCYSSLLRLVLNRLISTPSTPPKTTTRRSWWTGREQGMRPRWLGDSDPLASLSFK